MYPAEPGDKRWGRYLLLFTAIIAESTSRMVNMLSQALFFIDGIILANRSARTLTG